MNSAGARSTWQCVPTADELERDELSSFPFSFIRLKEKKKKTTSSCDVTHKPHGGTVFYLASLVKFLWGHKQNNATMELNVKTTVIPVKRNG